MKIKFSEIASLAACVLLLNSCASIPKNAKPVSNFDVNKYMGTWHEIAWFDFRFEKNLNNVSAQYKLNEKGNVIVLNSGYNYTKNKWKSAKGLAKFRDDMNEGALKVSFFKPIYAPYNVVAIDENYQYALVTGKNLDYLWILSKTKKIPDDVKNNYLKIAQDIGFDTSKLLWVKHDRDDNPFLNEK